MSKKLVIMESPTKSKAVQNYLGKDFIVLSSDGHIRNMATKGQYLLGINFDDFTPLYKIPRKKMPKIKALKEAAKKASHVYLATDPDREGEAISYHLNAVLGIGSISSRVTFNEITKEAILESFSKDHNLNMDLVYSQQARQMLDRIIGFRLSSLLQKKIGSRSAGRVQSVALKIIVMREVEIKNFIPKEFWTISANYLSKFSLKLEKYNNQALEINNEAEALKIKEELSNTYKVKSIISQKRKRNPLSLLTTSTLLQAAATQLNFTALKTTFIAQQLYEGIEIKGNLQGLISYPRTDSTRINDKFSSSVKKLIIETYGKEYLGTTKKEIKNQKNVQDAHEAIRPTELEISPSIAKGFLTRDQFKLYQLIYQRTIAAFMSPAQILNNSIIFDNANYQFKLTGQKIEFKGFLIMENNALEISSNEDYLLPDLNENETITIDHLDLTQNFTKPRQRYSEASLIRSLEELGIGRPSTYSPILNTLQKRGYVSLENKSFFATEKGILTNNKLQEFFQDIINEKYTSEVEEELDIIAQGKLKMNNVVREFWEKFEPRIEYAFTNMTEEKAIPKLLDEICPKCNQHNLIERSGRYGKFIACSGFPKCRFIKKEVQAIKPCPVCENGQLIVKTGKRKNNFLGCTNYPQCKHVEKYETNELKND